MSPSVSPTVSPSVSPSLQFGRASSNINSFNRLVQIVQTCCNNPYFDPRAHASVSAAITLPQLHSITPQNYRHVYP